MAMIAFGCSITHPDAYARYAAPGFARAAEADSEILAFQSANTIFRSYNIILDAAAELQDLEALALVHQDAELLDEDFAAKVREALSDPDVGVIGCVGAIGVRSIAWWEGSLTWASFIHRYPELGGGDLPAPTWDRQQLPAYARTGEVDTVDGLVMVLSPWVVRNLRFDESLGQLHGYDFDFCLQARAAGRKIVTADLRVIHNHSLELVNDPEGWIAAHIQVAEKWAGKMPGVGDGGGTWKQRARRGEAEAAVRLAQVVSLTLQSEARDRDVHRRIEELERVVQEMEHSSSWRITRPLRELGLRLRARRQRAAPGS